MITVTPGACAALAELLEDSNVPKQLLVRVVTDDDGRLDLLLEQAQLEDAVFNFRGRNVLAVESQAAVILSGTSLDL